MVNDNIRELELKGPAKPNKDQGATSRWLRNKRRKEVDGDTTQTVGITLTPSLCAQDGAELITKLEKTLTRRTVHFLPPGRSVSAPLSVCGPAPQCSSMGKNRSPSLRPFPACPLPSCRRAA